MHKFLWQPTSDYQRKQDYILRNYGNPRLYKLFKDEEMGYMLNNRPYEEPANEPYHVRYFLDTIAPQDHPLHEFPEESRPHSMLKNPNSLSTRFHEIPFWQKKGYAPCERDIEETLGFGTRESENPIRRLPTMMDYR
jgi:hypothetical protein